MVLKHSILPRQNYTIPWKKEKFQVIASRPTLRQAKFLLKMFSFLVKERTNQENN